ncbi:MAG TPA: C25 family cysteine peptidase [Planctomycetota bacterium]|nr:C25 family cysteine peptidase [Planctomycetota bacterium]
MRIVLALLLFANAGSKYVERDLDKVDAKYLVVASPAFADALDSLCDHRSKTYKVQVVRTDDVARNFGKGPEGLASFVKRVDPKFLLLAGDVDSVPTFIRKSEYQSDRFASDPDLATDHLYGPPTGRFPARGVEELQSMAARTVAYEGLPPGRWQKKISIITGEANFGTLIDELLERQFNNVVVGKIPPAFDVETAYAKPTSKYCYYPPKFGENALRMLNEGSLFYAYVGHGYTTGFDDVHYKDDVYPIFDPKSVKDVAVQEGFPIMVVIACSTGEYDSRAGDCIGELLFKRPKGPVAFIGGSRTTQPYGNGLFAHKLVEQVFAQRALTMGEALWAAKTAVVEKDGSALRVQADAIAGTIQGPASLEPMRKDVILQYNLLGDPALRIRRPLETIEMTPRGNPGAGRTFFVTGSAKDGPVEVTFECARDRFCHPTELEGDTAEDQINRRYANANNKVVMRSPTTSVNGSFETEIELPENLKPGKYFLKAHGPGAIGFREIVIPE